MKLGIAYNIFNGDELLEDSLKRLRPLSDYIVLVYQTVSNIGIKSKDIKNNLDLIDPSLYDDMVHHTPVPNTHPQMNETNKREAGRVICKENGCTHYMSIDCDEFYDEEQFLWAKKQIEENDYESTACELVNYFHDSKYALIEPTQYVPFITKITDIGHTYGARFIATVDPTRIVPNVKQHLFTHGELVMHHMSYIRKDFKSITSKLVNSPNRYLFDDILHDYLSYYDNWEFPMPGLNPHQFKRGDKEKNVVEVDNPIELSVSYTRRGLE